MNDDDFIPAHLLEKAPLEGTIKVEDGEIVYPKTDGYMETGTQPQQLNILTIPVPKRQWIPVLWARLKYRFKKKPVRNYAVWSRKGRCPECNVGTGSRHSQGCTVPIKLKGNRNY